MGGIAPGVTFRVIEGPAGCLKKDARHKGRKDTKLHVVIEY